MKDLKLRPMNQRVSSMIGQTYGRLTAIRYAGYGSHKHHVEFRCSCGNTKVLDIYGAASGRVRSCGCMRDEQAGKNSRRTHGMSKSRAYRMWRDMHTRCYNKKFKFYKYYGGRGIGISDSWRGAGGFERFIADMGHPPSQGMSVERKDNDKWYSKENCVWLHRSLQSKNRLYNWQVIANGKVITAVEASGLIGCSRKYADQKLRRLGANKRIPVPISMLL